MLTGLDICKSVAGHCVDLIVSYFSPCKPNGRSRISDSDTRHQVQYESAAWNKALFNQLLGCIAVRQKRSFQRWQSLYNQGIGCRDWSLSERFHISNLVLQQALNAKALS